MIDTVDEFRTLINYIKEFPSIKNKIMDSSELSVYLIGIVCILNKDLPKEFLAVRVTDSILTNPFTGRNNDQESIL